MADWNSFDKYEAITDKYLPDRGEGKTMATQTVTAVCKLVYKWFNDGDVFDNTGYLDGWYNNLSSYANWLAKYTGAKPILDRVFECKNEDSYTDLLFDLAESLFDAESLEKLDAKPAVGSIYKCEGKYRFVDYDDEDERTKQ